jgi:hypothetical protein
MAAVWAWTGKYGTSPGTHIELGTSGNLFNFKTLDSLTGAADYTSYPITAGNNSYEIFLRGGFSSTFNQVNNLQLWKSAGGPDTGVGLYWDGDTTAYSTPTTAASSIATAVVPTSDPGTANVSIGGSLGGALTAAGYSDYIVLQMKTLTTAAAGDTATYTFTMQYDEN